MKRNIIRNLFPALVTALVVVSCQVDSVTESTVVTRLEKNVYEVGENVRFHFSGEADFVTIFTGVDNYMVYQSARSRRFCTRVLISTEICSPEILCTH